MMRLGRLRASLKADLHLHTREAEAAVAHDARGLIDRASREGFRVLSITNHDEVTWSAELADHAQDRGIVLIPGVEATIEGRHVLVYNADVSVARLQTFADLRRYRTPDWLVIAPHPFFPASFSLRDQLLKEIDLFDAIEFSHFYTPWVDFNRPAVRLARAAGLPLVGTSDSHFAEQFGTTFSVIEAEASVESVLDAIRKRQVGVVSRPLGYWRCASIAARSLLAGGRHRTRRVQEQPLPATLVGS